MARFLCITFLVITLSKNKSGVTGVASSASDN
ncbi:hypothetical protein P4O66_008375, partial [Electrophorus voltai]